MYAFPATVTPIVRIENLPCTLYNKVCQANVILTKRLVPGRLHDFAVRVKDSKGDSNSMQATISVTNATTQRDQIFPHIPAIIMVPEVQIPSHFVLSKDQTKTYHFLGEYSQDLLQKNCLYLLFARLSRTCATLKSLRQMFFLDILISQRFSILFRIPSLAKNWITY